MPAQAKEPNRKIGMIMNRKSIFILQDCTQFETLYELKPFLQLNSTCHEFGRF